MITISFLSSLFFFFNDTATTEIYTLSLHDALPISDLRLGRGSRGSGSRGGGRTPILRCGEVAIDLISAHVENEGWERSEEHTSELQSHLNLVCRLLLEKKKKKQ